MTDTPLDLDYIEHRMASPMVTYRESVEEDMPALVAALRKAETAHAALIAGIETGLRESACAECDHDRCATYRSAASWVRDYAALDHHAPTTGATP